MSDIIYDCLMRLGAENIRRNNEGYESACPFHGGSSRNFRVAFRSSKTTGPNAGRPGAFKCHNPSCEMNQGGYLETLVMKAWSVPFKDAQTIIEEHGVGWEAPVERVIEEVNPEQFYPYVGNPCPYLLGRGLRQEDLDYFSIGYNEDENLILIPTFDLEDKLVGLTRREARPGALYIHTEFDKSRYLWGLDRALKRFLLLSPSVTVVEGQLDPLGLRPIWPHPAVAQMGDSLSDAQAVLLREHFAIVYLAYDNDEAGIMATCGAIDTLRDAGCDEIRILCYDAEDPADLAKADGGIQGVKTTSRWIADHL